VAGSDRAAIAAGDLGAPDVTAVPVAGTFVFFSGPRAHAGGATVIVDERGVVRAIVPDAHVVMTTGAAVDATLASAFDEYTRFGDGGPALPDVRLVDGVRIADLGGVADVEQAIALASEELAGCDPAAVVAIVAAPRAA